MLLFIIPPIWPTPLHDVILAQDYVTLAQVYVIQGLQHVICLAGRLVARGIASLTGSEPC
jgi:hypothetical protein